MAYAFAAAWFGVLAIGWAIARTWQRLTDYRDGEGR